MTATKAAQAETAARRADALDRLRALLPPGSTVRGRVEHVSSSGMTRDVTLEAIGPDPTPGTWPTTDITGQAARVLGARRGRDGWSIRVSGCGMDMVFHTVYSLSRSLYPDGHACTGVARWDAQPGGPLPCHSNDHSNGAPYVAGAHHADGGYALRRA